MRKRILATSSLLALAVAGAAITAVTSGDGVAEAATPSYNFAQPEVIATGLTVPWGLDFLPDGSALTAERNSGRIMQIRPGQAPQQVATISGVSASGESGLLGLAVSPTYAQDQWIYVYLTTASDNRIVRFRLSAPTTQTPILTGLARATIHDGGRIAFGPDGNLYAAVGDAGNTANAQNLQSRNGKILRMRPDGSVPPDNPFSGSLVYTLGHRNPQGLAWDAQGRMYASEFGQNTWDEVNLIVAGSNYGWPTVEGMGNNSQFRNPIVVWTTAEASPSGATISGDTLYVAALRGTRLWTVPLNGSGGAGTPTAVLQGQFGRLRTVELAPDGSLWVNTSNRDGRGTPAATDDRIIRFRQTGATTAPTTPPTTRPTTPPTTRPTTPPTTPPTTRPTTPPTTQPTTPPTTRATTPPTVPTGQGCSATYRIVGQWGGGFQGEVVVTNTGTSATTGWNVTWTFPNGQTITQIWGGTNNGSGSNVSVQNVSWNGNLAPGTSTNFGFLGSWNGTNGVPNNVTCTRV